MSRLHKSSYVVAADQLRKIEAYKNYQASSTNEPMTETTATIDVVRSDAERYASQRLQDAQRRIDQMYDEAQQQIEQWWNERRQMDHHQFEQMRAEGYQAGYEEGKLEANEEMSQQWHSIIQQANFILEDAYHKKNNAIQDAEQFVVELSVAIAEKIIGKQLTIEPAWIVDQIASSLARRKEQGVITVCVAPTQFSFVNSAIDELKLVVDSQADLKILPDATVKDLGCVIRSSYGSIDAKIDTQLAEIKQHLVQLALQNDRQVGDDV